MPKITSGNTGVPAMMIGEKASDIIKRTIKCGHQGGQYPYHTPKFTESSFDSDYDNDEDEILLPPEGKDNFNDDYEYPNYYPANRNTAYGKMVYPEEVRPDKDNFKDDYDYSSYYPINYNRAPKKMVYPEEVGPDQVYFDDSGKRRFYR